MMICSGVQRVSWVAGWWEDVLKVTKVLSYGIVLIKVIANKTLILNKRKGERFNNVWTGLNKKILMLKKFWWSRPWTTSQAARKMNDSGFCIVACPEIPRIIDRGIVSWMDVGFLDRTEGVIISSVYSYKRIFKYGLIFTFTNLDYI